MKAKSINYIWIVFLVTWGCSDFLEESSQNKVHPSMVSDLEQILLGDGYQEDHNFYCATEIFTDNIVNTGTQGNEYMETEQNARKWLYIWDKSMFDEEGGGYDSDYWEKPYSCILGCNLVLDYLNEMEGEGRLRESLRGEALALRAWCYFHLVNFFGVAYNQGNPDIDLGVPLKLNSTVTGEFYPRNTVGEVYIQIEKDLLEGNRLLTSYNYNRNFYRIGHLAVKAMLSRVYLYMEDWDKALAYADSCLMVKSDLLDLNTITWNNPLSKASVYSILTPDEIIWARKYESIFSTFLAYVSTPFIYSLEEEYGAGFIEYQNQTIRDLRGGVYLEYGVSLADNTSMLCAGVSKGDKDWAGFQGIRTAELYLNRAEANAQKYLKERNDNYRVAALADLNKLRRHRFNNAFPYEEVNISDGQELLEFCLSERRRELCGETNHRWCDLRRYGITVKHVLTEDVGKQEYEKNMGLYVLPIPKLVLEKNPLLVQN